MTQTNIVRSVSVSVSISVTASVSVVGQKQFVIRETGQRKDTFVILKYFVDFGQEDFPLLNAKAFEVFIWLKAAATTHFS